MIVARVGQPVAFPTARQVGADHPALARQRPGERLEIAAMPGQAVHADDRAPRGLGAAHVAGDHVKALRVDRAYGQRSRRLSGRGGHGGRCRAHRTVT